MKLLFDHNLSPRLVSRLADLYPDASHVSLVGLDRASDEDVWQYAQTYNYVIVTKDSDFSDFVVLRGFPPRVIWLRLGNCTTQQVEIALRSHYSVIETFGRDAQVGTLEVV